MARAGDVEDALCVVMWPIVCSVYARVPARFSFISDTHVGRCLGARAHALVGVYFLTPTVFIGRNARSRAGNRSGSRSVHPVCGRAARGGALAQIVAVVGSGSRVVGLRPVMVVCLHARFWFRCVFGLMLDRAVPCRGVATRVHGWAGGGADWLPALLAGRAARWWWSWWWGVLQRL